MDATGLLDLKLGETPFDNIKEIINSNDGFSCGSGDSFVKNKVEMDIDLVDMEAYALASVCETYKIPFRCFKYISDDGDAKQWEQNCRKGVELFIARMRLNA